MSNPLDHRRANESQETIEEEESPVILTQTIAPSTENISEQTAVVAIDITQAENQESDIEENSLAANHSREVDDVTERSNANVIVEIVNHAYNENSEAAEEPRTVFQDGVGTEETSITVMNVKDGNQGEFYNKHETILKTEGQIPVDDMEDTGKDSSEINVVLDLLNTVNLRDTGVHGDLISQLKKMTQNEKDEDTRQLGERYEMKYVNKLHFEVRSIRDVDGVEPKRGWLWRKLEYVKSTGCLICEEEPPWCWNLAYVYLISTIITAVVTAAVQATSPAGLFCFPYLGILFYVFHIPLIVIVVVGTMLGDGVYMAEDSPLREKTTAFGLGFLVGMSMIGVSSISYGIWGAATLPDPVLPRSNMGLYVGACLFYIYAIALLPLLTATDDPILVAAQILFIGALVSLILQAVAGELYMWPDIGATGYILLGWVPSALIVFGVSIFVVVLSNDDTDFEDQLDSVDTYAIAGILAGWLGLAIYGIVAIATLDREQPFTAHVGLYIGAVIFYISSFGVPVLYSSYRYLGWLSERNYSNQYTSFVGSIPRCTQVYCPDCCFEVEYCKGYLAKCCILTCFPFKCFDRCVSDR